MTEVEWMDIFATNLEEAILDSRMTKEELAEEADLTVGAISHYLCKRRMPSLKAIINLSYVLDIDLDDLIDFGDTIH